MFPFKCFIETVHLRRLSSLIWSPLKKMSDWGRELQNFHSTFTDKSRKDLFFKNAMFTSTHISKWTCPKNIKHKRKEKIGFGVFCLFACLLFVLCCFCKLSQTRDNQQNHLSSYENLGKACKKTHCLKTTKRLYHLASHMYAAKPSKWPYFGVSHPLLTYTTTIFKESIFFS